MKIGLVQINNSFSDQDYFPYSVGILQAYAQVHCLCKEKLEFLLPIYRRIAVTEAVQQLKTAEIVFFSAYVWNFKLSLEIARQLKLANSHVIIVFGGPQVPHRALEAFLRAHSFITLVCAGEGERTLVSILDYLATQNWSAVPAISFIDSAGRYVQTAACQTLLDLNDIPSPYLSGVFDDLIANSPQTQWIALWETNRGCPYACAYCDWGATAKKKLRAYHLDRVKAELDWFSQNKIEFIFCCDANFAILKRDIEIAKYAEAIKRKTGYPKALSVQSAKSFTENTYQTYKILSDADLNKGVSLSLQSLHDETLQHTRRKNISVQAFQDVQRRFTADGIETFTDLILALPGETYETFVMGADAVIANGQHNRIQFNNLSILPNAEMGDPQYQEQFGFVIVENDLINLHGSLEKSELIQEKQQLVVGTAAMPPAEWVRTRVFGWMAALLYFNKLLQIPLIVLHHLYGVRFRDLIELFSEKTDLPPVLSQCRQFFTRHAQSIQQGAAEFCESKKWLNIWWPADELMFIDLCAENKLAQFYQEVEQVLCGFLDKQKISHQTIVLREAILLNKNLIKLPFQNKNMEFSLTYNIWDIYFNVLRGRSVPLVKQDFSCTIDREEMFWSSWSDWARRVVWWQNKKGAYLYRCHVTEKTTVNA